MVDSYCDCLKEVLILDEADRLLDMGFKESLEGILRMLPKQRRTGLFSATQTDEIDKLIRAGLRNPCNIQVKQKSTSQNESEKQKTPIGLKNFFMVYISIDCFDLFWIFKYLIWRWLNQMTSLTSWSSF